MLLSKVNRPYSRGWAMKRMELSEDERRTPREMGVFHPHPRTQVLDAYAIIWTSTIPVLGFASEGVTWASP